MSDRQTEQIVRSERRGKVLEITIDRPPANAINRAASRAIYRALEELQTDPGLLVGIITGTGERIFSAGWDLKEAAAEGFDPEGDYHPETGFGPGGFAGITEYWDLKKPVIAAVNGAAVGGGFEIVIPCDLVVMSETAFFALPEMQRGILADGGAVQRLWRLLPYNVAKEMLLTGRRMDAEEALRWGLVNKVVAPGELMEVARALAEELSQGAPLALQALKEVLAYAETLTVREAMASIRPGSRTGLPFYDGLMASEDAREGVRAFAEKRAPRWQGR